MSSLELGTLQRIDDLRTIWRHEALDFTPWLVEHVDLLGKALEMDLEVIRREQTVGDFAVDILARDLGTGKHVVIENQLEDTDHSHLGQLITYAAGLEATVVIWVSRNIRDEHRQALDWLNRGDGATTKYFGVVVELLKIDNSKPAANLRVVVSPNDWSREAIRTAPGEDAEGKYALYKSFFQRLIDDLRENHSFTNARVGQAQNWYSFSTRVTGFKYSASFAAGGKVRVEVYIEFPQRDQNIAAFEMLMEKEALERAFGEPLEWERLEGRKACRIAVYRLGSIEDSDAALEEYHRWTVDHLLRFRAVFGPELPSAAARAAELAVVGPFDFSTS